MSWMPSPRQVGHVTRGLAGLGRLEHPVAAQQIHLELELVDPAGSVQHDEDRRNAGDRTARRRHVPGHAVVAGPRQLEHRQRCAIRVEQLDRRGIFNGLDVDERDGLVGDGAEPREVEDHGLVPVVSIVGTLHRFAAQAARFVDDEDLAEGLRVAGARAPDPWPSEGLVGRSEIEIERAAARIAVRSGRVEDDRRILAGCVGIGSEHADRTASEISEYLEHDFAGVAIVEIDRLAPARDGHQRNCQRQNQTRKGPGDCPHWFLLVFERCHLSKRKGQKTQSI
jgi:hypothetical protein